LDSFVPRGSALGHRDRGAAGAAHPRRHRGEVAGQAGARIHGPTPELPRASAPGRPRGQGAAAPGRRPWGSRRAVPAEYAALRDRILWRAQSRRHGRQLLAARRGEGVGTQDRGQPHRLHPHARPGGALSADGGDARHDAAAQAHRRQHRRDVACARGGGGTDEDWQADRRRRQRRPACRLCRTARQRRQLHPACDRRSARDDRGAAVHRRHDRCAQGRDADPRQPLGGMPAVLGDGRRHAAGARRGPGTHSCGAAAVSHLRAVGQHAARHPLRCGSRAARALRPRNGAQGDRGEEDLQLSRRADDVRRAARASGGRQIRPAFAQVLRLGRRAAAAGTRPALRAADRLPPERRLGDDGNFAHRNVHAGARPAQAGIMRHPASGHHDPDARPRQPQALRAAGRAWRTVHQRPERDEGLLEQPRCHRRHHHLRRDAAHRRRRLHGRGRLRFHCRPHQGHAPLQRLQRLPAQPRGGDLSAPGGGRGHRHRHP